MSKAQEKVIPETQGFKRKAAISVPQLKLIVDKTVFIKIDSAIQILQLTEKDGKKSECPAVKVIDLADGEVKELLLDMIPNDAFSLLGDKLVGMSFEVTKGQKVQSGKNGYHPYTIYEIEA